MGVVDPNAGIHHGLGAVKEELQKLNSKIDKLMTSKNDDVLRTEYAEGLTLNTQNHVIWWSKVKDAARYRLVLSFNTDEVCSIDCDRETRYYVFDKLPKDVYCLAKVIAEDREGKEIVSASIKL
jgi:hypothetical protein